MWVLFGISCLLFTLRLYSILPRSGRKIKRQIKRTSGCTVAVFLGSGGHTAEALALLSALDPKRYNRRMYIVSEGDNLSIQKAMEVESRFPKAGKPNYSILSVPRARRVHQRLTTVPISAAFSLFFCFFHFTIRPLYNKQTVKFADALILNGPGTCFIVCLAIYINRFLGLPTPSIIYVETFARIHKLSLSGKLMRPLADRFVTQWPDSGAHIPDNGKWLV